jgi:hypothetical protein
MQRELNLFAVNFFRTYGGKILRVVLGPAGQSACMCYLFCLHSEGLELLLNSSGPHLPRIVAVHLAHSDYV